MAADVGRVVVAVGNSFLTRKGEGKLIYWQGEKCGLCSGKHWRYIWGVTRGGILIGHVAVVDGGARGEKLVTGEERGG